MGPRRPRRIRVNAIKGLLSYTSREVLFLPASGLAVLMGMKISTLATISAPGFAEPARLVAERMTPSNLDAEVGAWAGKAS